MRLLKGKRKNRMMIKMKIVFLFLCLFCLFGSAMAEETKKPGLQVLLRDGIIIDAGPKPGAAPKANTLFSQISENMVLKTTNTSVIQGKVSGRSVDISWDSILSEASSVELLSSGLSPYKKGRILIRKRNGETTEVSDATLLKYAGHDVPVKEFIVYSYDGFNKSWREENLDIKKVSKISIISKEPLPPPVQVKPVAKVEKPKAVSATVMFEPGMYEIAPLYQKKLKAVAESVKGSSAKGRRIYVTGHTDYDKDKKRSLETSKKRAEAVRDFLVKKAGVPSSRIKMSYMGDKKPKATNKTPEGRAKNRRVEVVVK